MYDLFKEDIIGSFVGKDKKCVQKFSGEMYWKVGCWKNENMNVITIKWISEKYTELSEEHVQ